MNHWNRNLLTSVLAFFVVVALVSLPLILRAYDEIKDPVCGMKVDPAKAQFKSEYEGKTYYFCSAGCKAKFDANPAQYLKKEEKATGPGMQMMKMQKQEQRKEGCCQRMGMMEQQKCEEGKEGCCQEITKDAKFEVTNLPNGVQIKITSENPDVVKKIQEMHKDGKCCSMMMSTTKESKK